MSAADYRKMVGADKRPQTDKISAADYQKIAGKGKKGNDKNKREMAEMLRGAKIEFEEEYQFHPDRKWRFDFAIPERMIAIEYEGIFFGKDQATGKSRHTTVTGFMKDMEKYNAAASMGWTVLRYTTKTYKQVVNDLWNLQIKEK